MSEAYVPADDADRELIDRWKRGDPTAATVIVSRHSDALARFAVNMGERNDVEELVQDTFVRAFGSLHSFRGESALRTWLFTIARRLVLDRRRAASRDANGNLSTVNLLDGYASTVTSAGTLVLTVSSASDQYFTGTTTHTVTLPVVTTLVNGQSWWLSNNSTGTVTVQTSGLVAATVTFGAGVPPGDALERAASALYEHGYRVREAVTLAASLDEVFSALTEDRVGEAEPEDKPVPAGESPS